MAGDTQLRFTRGHMVRQVHGRDARPGAWPWHAAIYVDGTFQCSGVILNDNWTLTTAHCVYYDAKIKKRNILVRVGEWGGVFSASLSSSFKKRLAGRMRMRVAQLNGFPRDVN